MQHDANMRSWAQGFKKPFPAVRSSLSQVNSTPTHTKMSNRAGIPILHVLRMIRNAS